MGGLVNPEPHPSVRADGNAVVQGMSRRRFVVGTGLSFVAMTQLAAWVARPDAARAGAAGWSDATLGFGGGLERVAGGPDVAAYRALAAVANSHANTLRVPIRWDLVEAERGSLDWSGYEPVHRYAVWHGLRILPVLIGAPGWLNSEVQAAPNGLRYPVGSEALNCFGNFVVATIRHFSAIADCIDAVEIWSEPNNPQLGHIVDPAAFCRMVSTAAVFAQAESAMGKYPRPRRVVSGGVLLAEDAAAWEPYLDSAYRDLFPAAVGLHARGSTAATSTEAEYAEQVANQVEAAVSQVAASTGSEVWLTSTGATSLGPWGESGQAAALKLLSERLSEIDRCGALVVSPLYEPDTADRSESGETLLRSDKTPKPALEVLGEAWSQSP